MSIFTLKIKGITCDLALHPISKKTEKRIVGSIGSKWPSECFKFWKHGKTRHFGIRKDGIESVTACLDDKCINLDFGKINTLDVTDDIKYYNIPTMMFGFTAEIATCTFMWHNIDKFDIKKLILNVIDWKSIYCDTDFISIDDIFYNKKRYDSFDWNNPSGFHLLEPNIIKFVEQY